MDWTIPPHIQVLLVTIIGPAIGYLVPLYFQRRDGQRAARMASLSSEERARAEFASARSALSKEQTAFVDAVVLDLKRERERNRDLEADRDRGWDVARWWNRRAHQLWHDLSNVLVRALYAERKAGIVPIVLNQDPLPALEDVPPETHPPSSPPPS